MIPVSLLQDAKNILILGHQNADPDAVSSMLAFSRLYGQLNPQGRSLLAASDVSRIASQVARTFLPEFTVHSRVQDKFDLMVILDTNTRVQLGPELADIQIDPRRTIVIDHHEENEEVRALAAHRVIFSDRSSTCEIVAQLFDSLGVQIDSTTASLLLAGILFDTRRFLYGDRETLAASLRLVDAGADYQRCLASLVVQPDRSERIARLKAAQRAKIHSIGEWLIVTSKVSAYEASACRSLIDLGADVAIVGGCPTRNVVRISSRCTNDFQTKTGINMGRDVMEPLGPLIDGAGGGHLNAAGANGRKNLDRAIKEAVELIRHIASPIPDSVSEPI